MSLTSKVCLVTGASRGVGKGIALQLGQAGATVYITGRTLNPVRGSTGSLKETAAEVESRGGVCIPVQCDHTKDEDIQKVFERIKKEQHGKLDLLVNNAFSAISLALETESKKFWELPPSMWDDVNNVGLRNYYLCTVHATRMMVDQGEGMILMISSKSGVSYMLCTAYGVGKAAVDRMAVDCGYELRNTDVVCTSLWIGTVRTEVLIEAAQPSPSQQGKEPFWKRQILHAGITESQEFTGKVVVCLMKESNSQRRRRNGKVIFNGDVADQYGIRDIDGSRPANFRSISGALSYLGYTKLAWFFPRFLKLPTWLFTLMGHKF